MTRPSLRVGWYAGPGARRVDDVVQAAAWVRRSGIRRFWIPQALGVDPIVTVGAVLAAVPDIHVGSAVLVLQSRHPVTLAQEAITLAQLSGGGRFTLGVGVGHRHSSEGRYGVPYGNIAHWCAEPLGVIAAMLATASAAIEGPSGPSQVRLEIEPPPVPPRLLLAAMGPRMVDLAGRSTDGTITWMTGPRLLAEQIVPRLRASAATAGRPDPHIVVGLPVVVTDRVDRARGALRGPMTRSATLASYRRNLDIEALDDPTDLALIGDEDHVARRISLLVDAGATELVVNPLGPPEDLERTLAFVASLTSADR